MGGLNLGECDLGRRATRNNRSQVTGGLGRRALANNRCCEEGEAGRQPASKSQSWGGGAGGGVGGRTF